MVTRTDKRREKHLQQQALLAVLKSISPTLHENTLPPQKTWPSTGQLAKALDLSIYRTRYLLLDMAKKNQVLVSTPSLSHSLRWLPAEKLPTDDTMLFLLP